MKSEGPDWIRPYLGFFLLSFLLIVINAKDLLFLKKSDIGDGRVVYHRSKTKRLYSIPVPPEAWESFRKYLGKKYLLNIIETHVDYQSYVRQTNRALQFIGMTYRHGFKSDGKHTWATIAASLDEPIYTIALALGHGRKTVTYIH